MFKMSPNYGSMEKIECKIKQYVNFQGEQINFKKLLKDNQ